MASDLSASFQYVAFKHLEDRVSRAMTYFERVISSERISENKKIDTVAVEEDDSDGGEADNSGVYSLVVVGGVAANLQLRK